MPKIKFSTKSHKIKTKTKSTQIYLICSLKASYFKVYYLKIETGTYFIQLCFQEKNMKGQDRKKDLVWLHPVTVWAINAKSQKLFCLPLKSMEEQNYCKSILSWEVKYLLTLKERLSWLQDLQ